MTCIFADININLNLWYIILISYCVTLPAVLLLIKEQNLKQAFFLEML